MIDPEWSRVYKQFGLDLDGGFVHINRPAVSRMADDAWKAYEAIASNLPVLILTGQIRRRVRELYLPATTATLIDAMDELEAERLFALLCFVMHGYVRGSRRSGAPLARIPAQLAVPLRRVASRLGLQPIACYASTVLYNWRLVDETAGFSLDNIRCIFLSTGSIDELWFYAISAAIEVESGPVIVCALRLAESMHECLQTEQPDNHILRRMTECLHTLDRLIQKIIGVFERIYEECIPTVFYQRVRRYLAGWKNDSDLTCAGMEYAGLAEDGSDNVWLQLSGASAAQSSLIQVLDIILGISHDAGSPNCRSTDQPPPNTGNCAVDDIGEANSDNGDDGKTGNALVGHGGEFLRDMRTYMPAKHRMFLEWLEQRYQPTLPVVISKLFMLRDDVDEERDKTIGALEKAYCDAVGRLKEFRDKHLRVVAKYVVSEASKSAERSHSDAVMMRQDVLGTGGSNPIPLLREIRQDTIEASQRLQQVLSIDLQSRNQDNTDIATTVIAKKTVDGSNI